MLLNAMSSTSQPGAPTATSDPIRKRIRVLWPAQKFSKLTVTVWNDG